MKEVITASILEGFDFFKGWSWLKFNNLGMPLEIYSSMLKALIIKVRKFFTTAIKIVSAKISQSYIFERVLNVPLIANM